MAPPKYWTIVSLETGVELYCDIGPEPMGSEEERHVLSGLMLALIREHQPGSRHVEEEHAGRVPEYRLVKVSTLC